MSPDTTVTSSGNRYYLPDLQKDNHEDALSIKGNSQNGK